MTIQKSSPVQRVIRFLRLAYIAIALMEPRGYKDSGVTEMRWSAIGEAIACLRDPYVLVTILISFGAFLWVVIKFS